MIPSFAKVFELIILTRLQNYFDSRGLLTPSQFGFKKGFSTSSAINNVMEAVLRALDGSQCVGAIYCDLSKAFDCVNHSVLINKLKMYGVEGAALTLLSSYLTDRKQTVSIKNGGHLLGDWIKVSSGVPQGSILGPFLFSIYLNDLPSNMNSNIVCYADDTTALSSCHDIHTLESAMNQEYVSLNRWFSSNGLYLNEEKTKVMVFSPMNRDLANFKVNGITPSDSALLLGVTIDGKLSWTKHIDNLCSRLSSLTFAFKVLMPVVNKETILQIYYAYVYSRMKYAIGFWGSSNEMLRVFRLQKRIVRVMCKAGYRVHCKPFFQQLNLITLPGLYILEVLTFFKNNPHLFENNIARHHYNTRHKGDMVYPIHRLTLLEKGLHYSALRLYNVLPLQLKNIACPKMFLKKVKQILLEKCPYSVEEFLSDC